MLGSAASPLVSFVVPCFNYGRYLPDCLDSIFGQEGGVQFEVVVIDDGSTDNTKDVIGSYRDPRMRAFTHGSNLGHVQTINEGLAEARGAFIARIDPDDRYRSCFLSAVVDKFATYPEVGLVYGDAALINDRGEITQERCDRVHGGRDFEGNEFIRLLEHNFICSATVIARREAWRAALPVPDDLAFHDWYFTIQMARTHPFYYVNTVLSEYRVHEQNHHARIVREKREEPSMLWLLDRIFSEPETIQEMEARKQRARRRVYGARYAELADKYFFFGMMRDARRCYVRAVAYRPRYLLRAAIVRRLAGTLVGRERYEAAKSLFNGALGRGRTG